MEHYFKRQYELWGEKTQNSLKEKSIAIIGCGGLGSNLGITLGSSGIGTIYLVDFDRVSLHNIHRQIAFTLQDVDKPKAQTLETLMKSRYDKVELISIVGSFEEFVSKNIQVDIIVDATDNLPTRVQIEEYAKKIKRPWVYTSVEQWHGQFCFFKEASFQDSLVISERTPEGIAAPIVSLLAAFEANLVLRYLAGLPVAMDAFNYIYFDDIGQITLKTFKI